MKINSVINAIRIFPDKVMRKETPTYFFKVLD